MKAIEKDFIDKPCLWLAYFDSALNAPRKHLKGIVPADKKVACPA